MKIGTHNGAFHCDEVLACFMLKELPIYKDAEIIRTRDPKLLETCDIVVDVGGVYDHAAKRYDHHQRSFAESMSSLSPEKKWTTKLSSAGLVYLHYGRQLIAQMLGSKEEDKVTGTIYDKIYETFVEEVDAIDNGISQCDGEPRYSISSNLSSRVGYLNPRWNDDSSPEMEKHRFNSAMRLVGTEFKDRVDFYCHSWLPARSIVEHALKSRHQVDSSGEIIKLESGGCPWKDHLHALEAEMGLNPQVKFTLYADSNNKWRVQCVPKVLGGFENRLSLLEAWCGIRDAQLSELSGIDGCIFVHTNGFIGGNETYKGALEMARKTLESRK
ncbi:hypothetical protein CAPTEDRAFT_225005 [Capitella teleta]|uniref:Uncharacterized protein n=1 Tax=Capitella teleta TaxID=283909 RepID=R7V123_CAPTE|nr:hypothetical protein CAPTEDRAFT_225005 [Capitella teleta]|eukprot:ELU12172.1 hypothetical protein CAPTEDRAFT_225005 [Capitella teleta]